MVWHSNVIEKAMKLADGIGDLRRKKTGIHSRSSKDKAWVRKNWLHVR